MQHDFYRPGAVHRMQALLDRHRRITGWSVRKASASALAGRDVPADRLWTSEADPDALPAGLLDHYSAAWYELDSPLPRGPSRGGHDVVDAFATQMFIDEIARQMRRDRLALRMELLGEPRILPGNAPPRPAGYRPPGQRAAAGRGAHRLGHAGAPTGTAWASPSITWTAPTARTPSRFPCVTRSCASTAPYARSTSAA